MKKTTVVTTTTTTTSKTATAVPATKVAKAFNAASYVKPGVTEADILTYKTAFDLFDTDQGGSVDANQLKAAMVSLGFDLRDANVYQMISDLDSDGNAQIDFDEWVHLMSNRVSVSSSKASILKIFPLYDDEKTDHISVKNLRRVAVDLGEEISEEELQEMIDRADLDRDGLVNFEEFYTILTRKIKD